MYQVHNWHDIRFILKILNRDIYNDFKVCKSPCEIIKVFWIINVFVLFPGTCIGIKTTDIYDYLESIARSTSRYFMQAMDYAKEMVVWYFTT